MKRIAGLVMFVLVACGTSPATEPGTADGSSGCDTAFVFASAQPSAEVLAAMRAADLKPVETRFSTPGAASGATGGSVGSPGHVGTVEAVESALEMGREMHGVEPVIIGIRVRGDVAADALADLGAHVHTRMLVPTTAAVALVPPDVGTDPVKVVRGGSCGA